MFIDGMHGQHDSLVMVKDALWCGQSGTVADGDRVASSLIYDGRRIGEDGEKESEEESGYVTHTEGD